MKSVFVSPIRFYTVFFGVILSFSTLGGRLVHLQVWQAEKYERLAKGARKNFITEKSRRGDLVDRMGNLLATTRSVVVVGIDPHSFNEEDQLKIPELARLLEISPVDLGGIVEKKFRKVGESMVPVRWIKLKEDVDEVTYRKIKQLKVGGVYGNYKHSRFYPNNSLAAHVVGYVNKEGTACMGVELLADYYLKGQDGWRETERDGRRREMPQFRELVVKAEDGLNVELTIDRVMQDVVEDEVEKIIDEFSPLSASVIVSHPVTGEVLAMANGPSFNPNSYNDYPLDTHRNRCLTDLYEPGSTFKIVPVGAALNEGIFEPLDIIDCSKSTFINGKKTLRLPSDHHPLGKISLHQVVQKSSNRGAAQIGLKLGAESLYGYSRSFGFGETTNLGLEGERSGMLHPTKSWDGLTITRLPMGHAIAVTPMQVHCSMSVIANGGILMKPILIRRVFDHKGKTVVAFKPQSKRRVISQDASTKLAEMLSSVVSTEGTARSAMIPGYEVAGKTGTTQKIINGKYSNLHHVASFSGFLPANDPKVLITIVVDEPQMKKGRLGYGGSVAGPSFQRIAKRIVTYLGIKPKSPDLSLNRL